MKHLNESLDEFARAWASSLPYIETETSGSTGEPKMIRLSKHDMLCSARATLEFLKIRKGSRFICPMDFRYIGAKMMYVRAKIADGELINPPPSNLFSFDGFADLLAIVPSQVDNFIAQPTLLSRIKNIIIGGSFLNNYRRDFLLEYQHKNKNELKIFCTYGMTETASHVALSPLSSDIYTGLPGITFSKDSRDCLVINLIGRDANQVVTNDIVELIDGSNFRIIGRHDNVINSGGLKIQPELIEPYIETVLNKFKIPFSGILVTSSPSAKWGEEAVCFIETSINLNECQIKIITENVKQSLEDKRKAPRKYIAITKLNRTSTGKIIRKIKSK